MLSLIVTVLLVLGIRAQELSGQYSLPPRPAPLNTAQLSPQFSQPVQQYPQPYQPTYLPSQPIQTVQPAPQLLPIPPAPTAPPQIPLAPTLPPNSYPQPNAIQTNPIPFPSYAPPASPLAPSPLPSSGCTLGCPQPQYVMGTDGNYYQYSQPTGTAPGAAAGAGTGSGAAAEEEATTKGPPNRFNDAGWETDDNGNVYVGNDDAKLYLISVGSFWPFPKDYRKKRSLPGPSLEQLLGFSKM